MNTGESCERQNVVVGTSGYGRLDWLETEDIHREIIAVLKKRDLSIWEAENILRDTQNMLRKIKVENI